MVELISLHMPKCNGAALRQGLIDAYGDAVHLDYNDPPFNPASAANIDPEGYIKRYSDNMAQWLRWKVIHGHFYLPKYKAAAAARITVLRHPVQRLISHYFYWKIYPRHNHPIHNYLLDNNLSLLEFAKLPSVRHFYSGVYFRGTERSELDFVGRSENMPSVIRAIEKITGKTISLPIINKNPYDQYDVHKQKILENKAMMAELQDLLREDIALYEKWCQ